MTENKTNANSKTLDVKRMDYYVDIRTIKEKPLMYEKMCMTC
jgi:hypothetical protein